MRIKRINTGWNVVPGGAYGYRYVVRILGSWYLLGHSGLAKWLAARPRRPRRWKQLHQVPLRRCGQSRRRKLT